MARDVRRRAFRRLGSAGAAGLGLPAAREKDLLLADTWRRVAGPAVAARATALRVARGILEIEIADRRWADALAGPLPALATKAALLAPALRIRSLRVRLAGGEEILRRRVEAPSSGREDRDAAPRPPRSDRPQAPALDPARLARIGEAYSRAAARRRERGRRRVGG